MLPLCDACDRWPDRIARGLDRVHQIIRTKRLLQADHVRQFRRAGNEIQRRHSGDGNDRQVGKRSRMVAMTSTPLVSCRNTSTIATSKLRLLERLQSRRGRWPPRRCRNDGPAARSRSSRARPPGRRLREYGAPRHSRTCLQISLQCKSQIGGGNGANIGRFGKRVVTCGQLPAGCSRDWVMGSLGSILPSRQRQDGGRLPRFLPIEQLDSSSIARLAALGAACIQSI